MYPEDALQHGVVQGACCIRVLEGLLILGNKSKNAEAMGQLGRLTSVSRSPAKGVLTMTSRNPSP
jgi:hypothetical protein